MPLLFSGSSPKSAYKAPDLDDSKLATCRQMPRKNCNLAPFPDTLSLTLSVQMLLIIFVIDVGLGDGFLQTGVDYATVSTTAARNDVCLVVLCEGRSVGKRSMTSQD